ncbi:MAG: TrkA C-terminal domain-containing protein [Halovenus sp.]
MVSDILFDIGLGVYLGLLAGIFPAVVAFALGFSFRYLTGVSIPGLGVVVLAGGLAGISGGLVGLLDEEVAQSSAGMAAFLIVLMLSLWAHSQGDKLGAAVPHQFTLSGLRQVGLSADILERVDSYGQIRIKPIGSIEDIEGYPPLSEETRESIRADSWKFSADLSLPELEMQLSERLLEEYGLSEVEISINADGLAEIRAAPGRAGLSRRVPSGKRAASIKTLLPTGLAIGDRVRIDLAESPVTGKVVSARTASTESNSTPAGPDGEPETDGGTDEKPVRAPTTDGGDGSVTVALSADEARRLLGEEFAKITVQSRGKSREYEALDILQRDGNQFELVSLEANGPFDGVTIGESAIRDRYGVAILAIRRRTERIVAPRGSRRLEAGDELIITGKPNAITSFREETA